MNYETFLRDLHEARDRAGRFRERALGREPVDTLLTGALQELDIALEELRVTEEELRVQTGELERGRATVEAQRERYQALFQQAPAAYLVTDPYGLIREANLRAAGLLGVEGRFLTGKPLASFFQGEERWRFRELVRRLAEVEAGQWQARLLPRGRAGVPVALSVAVGRDGSGRVRELRWLVWPLPDGDAGAGPAGVPAAADPAPLEDELPAVEDLAAALHEVVDAAVPLLGADGAGLMVADDAGALRWVTATGEAEQAFERAQRDLGEGPCIDAFAGDEVVWTADLRSDPRWPRLGPAAAGNQIRGVLSVPVRLAGQILGTCNAISRTPRGWTESDAAAIAAFATVIGRLIGSTNDARRKGDLVHQLQGALDSRMLIEQAKGVLMASEGLSAEAAFDKLRRRARSRSRKIDEVAREIIADRSPRTGRPGGQLRSSAGAMWRSPGPV